MLPCVAISARGYITYRSIWLNGGTHYEPTLSQPTATRFMEEAIIPICRKLPSIVHGTLVQPRRSDIEFKLWSTGHLSKHGAESQSPYASLLFGPNKCVIGGIVK
ncbi:uncharacterized protein [Bombus fervidus]|uniref:uncharacterized protein n=1 Tax=Bombus fervidus TaxID=203811 RepID=UPI003D187A75